MPRVGIIANPAAGRDIRRLTGFSNVVDNYTKRRITESVLVGLASTSGSIDVSLMPDKAGIGRHAVDNAPRGVSVRLLDIPVTQSPDDTRRAAERFRTETDVVVVLGGDGTNRDAAMELGDVPLISISTGTNNVVPRSVDGTVAGIAAGLLAAEQVPSSEVTYRHGIIEATVHRSGSVQTLYGLATVEISSCSFVGTRATLRGSDLVGGLVSRADPIDIGLSGIAGALEPLSPGEKGGLMLRFEPPDQAARSVDAVIVPGAIERMGIAEFRRVETGESVSFRVRDGVLGADGERELEIVDGEVRMTVQDRGPRVVSIDEVLVRAARMGLLER